MLRKLTLTLATLAALGGSVIATTTPAAADPWGYHRGWHRGFGFGFGPPVFVPGPVIYDGPRCYNQRRWVHDYWGWHRAWRRVCY